jgi:hypothetical protein
VPALAERFRDRVAAAAVDGQREAVMRDRDRLSVLQQELQGARNVQALRASAEFISDKEPPADR